MKKAMVLQQADNAKQQARGTRLDKISAKQVNRYTGGT